MKTTKQKNIKNIFKKAIDKNALKKACKDPEFIAIIKKINY